MPYSHIPAPHILPYPLFTTQTLANTKSRTSSWPDWGHQLTDDTSIRASRLPALAYNIAATGADAAAMARPPAASKKPVMD
ncbi:hypothetical protein CDD81_975 [Ophiocordyceps australis]|uniref:Uncharacterized protein n=1 Tax=Ophiocordyceps australis TaxID=1399860 RepID=A0A2C5X8C0_9HYPO|nr:hypothetical protein CDD81_975 [Ophiocordyceps australis]